MYSVLFVRMWKVVNVKLLQYYVIYGVKHRLFSIKDLHPRRKRNI